MKKIITLLSYLLYTILLIIIFSNILTIDCPDSNSNFDAHNICQNTKNTTTVTFSLLVGGPPVIIALSMIGIHWRTGGLI